MFILKAPRNKADGALEADRKIRVQTPNQG
jgi:hypothetical protein